MTKPGPVPSLPIPWKRPAMKNNNSRPSAPQPESASLLQPDAIAALKEAVVRIQNGSAAGALAKCSPGAAGSPQEVAAHVLYRHRILEQAGSPTDPLVEMVIEQFLLANQAIHALFVRAAERSRTDGQQSLPFHRGSLDGRMPQDTADPPGISSPVPPQQLMIVGQQNVAAGDQQVAYVNTTDCRGTNRKKTSDIEMTSKPVEALEHEQPELIAQSEACRGRPAEPVKAQRPDRRRPREIAAQRAEEPPLATHDGATNGRW